jgi:hypothetical protein
MYKNDVRVFSSPPVFRQGYSPHEALFLRVVGEPIAGSITVRKNGLIRSSILRQISGKGGLSN